MQETWVWSGNLDPHMLWGNEAYEPQLLSTFPSERSHMLQPRPDIAK